MVKWKKGKNHVAQKITPENVSAWNGRCSSVSFDELPKEGADIPKFSSRLWSLSALNVLRFNSPSLGKTGTFYSKQAKKEMIVSDNTFIHGHRNHLPFIRAWFKIGDSFCSIISDCCLVISPDVQNIRPQTCWIELGIVMRLRVFY